MRLLRNTAIYMGGTLANQAAAYLVLPILTQYLTPAEYGSAALFTTLVGFLSPVVGMSLRTHIVRNFFKVSRVEIARINGNALLGVTFNFGITLLLCTGFGSQCERWLGVPFWWAVVAVFVAALNSVSGHLTAFLRVEGKAVQFGTFEFFIAVSNLAVSLLLVASAGWGWQGRAAGYAVSALAGGSVGLYFLRRQRCIRGPLDVPLLRGLYRISLPLVPHAIAGQTTAMSSRFFLDGISGKAAVGIYTVGYTFGSLVNLPAEALNDAWTPWIYKKLATRTPHNDLRIVQVIYSIWLSLAVLCALLWMLAPVILRLATSEAFHEAAAIVRWVSIAFVFQAMYMFLVPVLVEAGKTDFLGICTVLVALLNLALNYVLIGQHGAMGAAYAAIVSFACRFLLVFLYVYRVRKLPWLQALTQLGKRALLA